MTQARQRLKPHIRQRCKFLQTLSEICLKPVVNRAIKASRAMSLAVVCNMTFSNHDNLILFDENKSEKLTRYTQARNDPFQCMQYRLLTH